MHKMQGDNGYEITKKKMKIKKTQGTKNYRDKTKSTEKYKK